MSATCPSTTVALLIALLATSPILGIFSSAAKDTENIARSSDVKIVSIFTKMGLTDNVVNNLIMVNSTTLSYGAGVIIGTLFFTVALYENGFFGNISAANEVLALAATDRLGLAATDNVDAIAPMSQLHQMEAQNDYFFTAPTTETSYARSDCKHFFKGRRKR